MGGTSLVTMYDSTVATDIPANVTDVAGYVDGSFMWQSAWWDRFPSARKTRIATIASTLDADALDVETGDATPAQTPDWVRKSRPQRGRLPWVYCNRSNRSAVENACSGLRYRLWVSTLDGFVGMQPGALVAATQYAGENSGSGGHFDLSLVDPSAYTESGSFSVVPESSFSESFLIVMHHLIQQHLFGLIDPSGQGAFVIAVQTGTPMNSIYDGWASLPQSQAYTAALARLVATTGTVDHLASESSNPAVVKAAVDLLTADMTKVLADLQGIDSSL